MNKEENSNHTVIEVLNNNGDLKLTKFRNPRAIWQDNDYPDEYIFRDVDIVNIFQLIQENKQLKEEINKISKKELKVRDMLYSIENGTLTRDRLKQIEEVLFEI